MSADLESRPELVEVQSPEVTVNLSQSSDITHEDGTAGEEEVCQTPETGKPSENSSTDEEECITPKSPKHMIPKTLCCPPAPRKTRQVASCKRKLFEMQFLEVVAQEKIDSFLRQLDVNSKRRCLV